ETIAAEGGYNKNRGSPSWVTDDAIRELAEDLVRATTLKLMPFPANWLEELVAEWLNLDGFLVEIQPPVQIQGKVQSQSKRSKGGGRAAPDIVGGRIKHSRLEIRHCETTVWFSEKAETDARRYEEKKFSPSIQNEIEKEFRRQFGLPPSETCVYDRWVIFGGASRLHRQTLRDRLPESHVYQPDDFICECVLPTIKAWKSNHPTLSGQPPTLPPDKWLICLLDYLCWWSAPLGKLS